MLLQEVHPSLQEFTATMHRQQGSCRHVVVQLNLPANRVGVTYDA